MTRPARIGWFLFSATLVLLAVQTTIIVSSHTPLRSDEQGLNAFPIITVGTALGAWIGAVIVSRDPGNRVGCSVAEMTSQSTPAAANPPSNVFS